MCVGVQVISTCNVILVGKETNRRQLSYHNPTILASVKHSEVDKSCHNQIVPTINPVIELGSSQRFLFTVASQSQLVFFFKYIFIGTGNSNVIASRLPDRLFQCYQIGKKYVKFNILFVRRGVPICRHLFICFN